VARPGMRVRLTALVLALVGLVVLGQAAVAPGQQKKVERLEHPYYPLRPGATWLYRASDNQNVTVRALKEEVFEIQRGDKREKVMGMVLEVKRGEMVLTESVAVLSDGIYRLAGAGKEIVPPLCFLKLPSQKGTRWECDSKVDGKEFKGSFVVGEEEVTVPRGKFQAITSSFTGPSGMTLKYWFAANVGVVKQMIHVNNIDIVLELEK
jgi:hypothetical protein